MKKVSVILPVYNEEFFLPYVLANINDYVDEIIIVDGSVKGQSTDKTAEIAKSYEKVKYFSGTFITDFGGWDMGGQRNLALEHVTGDTILVLSADMIIDNMEMLRNSLEGDYDLFGIALVEFWLDTRHIRAYANNYDLYSTPSANFKIIAVNMDRAPSFNINGGIKTEDDIEYDRCLYIPQVTLLHFGWIRPFRQQVQKHIRHVKMGLWGETGSNLLRMPKKDLEQWAIRHSLTYRESRYLDFYGTFPDCANDLIDMRADYGCNNVIKEYENNYGHKVLDYTHKKAAKND